MRYQNQLTIQACQIFRVQFRNRNTHTNTASKNERRKMWRKLKKGRGKRGEAQTFQKDVTTTTM